MKNSQVQMAAISDHHGKKVLLQRDRPFKASLSVRLLFAVVLLIVFALSGCSALPSGSTDPEIKDGVLKIDGVTIDFGANVVSEDSETTVSVLTPDEDNAPDGLASELYELDMETLYDEAVTVTMQFDGETPDDEDAQLMLGVGSLVETTEGDSDTYYSYIPVELEDGTATASFSPADYADLTVRGNSTSGSTPAPYKERVNFALCWVTTTYIDGGHFIVYMPLKTGSFYLNFEERDDLLSDLEYIYNYYLDKGYTYSKRDDWPMSVTIKSLKNEGEYYYSWNIAGGSLYLSTRHFDNGYTAGSLNPLLAHEFFHFVQANYVDNSNDLIWMAEATACYFEMMNTARTDIPAIVCKYNEKIFTGPLPADDTAANGYARMPLIDFLSTKYTEECIHSIYKLVSSGTDWDTALLKIFGSPKIWAGDFYESVVKGECSSGFSPYTLHKEITNGSAYTSIGTAMSLVMPETDEIAVLQQNDEPVLLGKATIHIESLGAHVVALTIDDSNLEKLPDGVDPVIKVSGGDLRVFTINGKYVDTAKNSGGVTLTDFKDTIDKGYRILALVTDLDDKGARDIEVTVEIEPFPTLDELVGVYTDGCMTYTEVFISDAVREEAAAAAVEAEENADSDEDLDLGCDMNIIESLDALVGQSNEAQLIIVKTGENTGTLTGVSDDDEDAEEPIPFTYENGYLIFDYEYEEGYSIIGTLSATYGKNKDVLIDGILTILTPMPDDFWIEFQMTGSKPLDSN